MRIDELIGYKKDLGSNLGFMQIGQMLTKKGFTRLGGGSFGEVWLPPGKGYVLKLFDAEDRAYMHFIRKAMGSGNPHFPRVIGAPVRVTDMTNAIRLEPLQQLWTWNRPAEKEALVWFTWAAQNPDWEEKLQVDGMQYHRHIVADLLKKNPDLVRAMELLRQWKGSAPGSIWDLVPSNIMLRGNTPVIVDPWKPNTRSDQVVDTIRAKLR